MTKITESDIENFAIDLLEQQGYTYLSAEQQDRENIADVVLRARLKSAIDKFNPSILEDAKEQVLREVLSLSGENLSESNLVFHQMLTDGVRVEYQEDGNTTGGTVWLVDFKNPLNNDLSVCNQFTVTENNTTRRPNIILLVNGLPLVVIELKNPTDENATVKKAFTNCKIIKPPSLLCLSTTACWSPQMGWMQKWVR